MAKESTKKRTSAPPAQKPSLARYSERRSFSRTPEPAPRARARRAAESAAPTRFVIHRHEARHLHYDLRLELDGVLKCWAVPKGFSFVPAQKFLAVQTEDHPLEYLEFEGVIPQGEYGAGNIVIWDSGNYEWRGKLAGKAALDAGKVEFFIDGGRLRGEWHLVKTRRGPNDWLLFKYRDIYARETDEPLFPLDLSRTRRTPAPQRVRARVAKPIAKLPTTIGWFYELEFGGLRLTIARDRDGEVTYRAPSGARRALALPELELALATVHARAFVLDGVLVAEGDQDRRGRESVEHAIATSDTAALKYYAFDLLYYEAWDLRNHALAERKRALKALLPQRAPNLLFVDHLTDRGAELLEVVAASGLTGIVGKRADSAYSARSDAWISVPAPKVKVIARPPQATKRAAVRAVSTAGARIKFSNLAKLYWPENGITKGQLLEYYDTIAENLLPHLHDRPVHLRRMPEGIHGAAFYHKNLAKNLPPWVETVVVGEENGEPLRYIVCNNRDTLLYLVNLGSIDLHPWLSRRGHLDACDFCVIDLDPPEDGFALATRLAVAIGKLLRSVGLRPLVKTSGASGLHIYIPLTADHDYAQSLLFAELVARWIVRDHGEIATVERAVGRRGNRVYIDFGQNRRGQTVVAPYVVRPVVGATVSAPLDWDEVASDLTPQSFTLDTMPTRVRRLGDLFRPALDDPQPLAPAIAALAKLLPVAKPKTPRK
ncbi:MAG: non-homologous end-joining DNA ligase [Planctomycetota bacterium]